MSIDYFKFAADVARAAQPAFPPAKRRATDSLSVEFDGFTVEAAYHLEGRHYAATETSPAEYPVVIVDEARITCGDFTVIAPFELLAPEVRERVEDAITFEEASR